MLCANILRDISPWTLDRYAGEGGEQDYGGHSGGGGGMSTRNNISNSGGSHIVSGRRDGSTYNGCGGSRNRDRRDRDRENKNPNPSTAGEIVYEEDGGGIGEYHRGNHSSVGAAVNAYQHHHQHNHYHQQKQPTSSSGRDEQQSWNPEECNGGGGGGGGGGSAGVSSRMQALSGRTFDGDDRERKGCGRESSRDCRYLVCLFRRSDASIEGEDICVETLRQVLNPPFCLPFPLHRHQYYTVDRG